ncbi:Atu4866 domain-containing protein [Dyadobacter tibetensis]|uniref:Atu4866 domain-containing protein n=1 Tax=Dyadobacter tibetensis TaxID=1211851 RepID=UPI0004B66F8B|nr:Atu4866 domain-containing protein [Dyadobacter tibetensis]
MKEHSKRLYAIATIIATFNTACNPTHHVYLHTGAHPELSKTNKLDSAKIEDTKAYLGKWVTEDGYIKHYLLPNSRYKETRGNKENAYQGTYQVTGNHIDYKDDTGFTADGEFKNGILYHAGMVLYKEINE